METLSVTQKGLPTLTYERSHEIQKSVLSSHDDLSMELPRSMVWLFDDDLHDFIDDVLSMALITRVWKIVSNGQFSKDGFQTQRDIGQVFYMGLLLAARANNEGTVYDLVHVLRRTLQERGGDYGSLVLDVLGVSYTVAGMQAKVLRIAHKYITEQKLLYDECLDLAGYAVLHKTVLLQHKEKDG